jgi:hypothetical protein
VNKVNPDIVYTAEQLNSEPLASHINANENTIMGLNSADPVTREQANRQVGLAVNFITMTPFMFAVEGR